MASTIRIDSRDSRITIQVDPKQPSRSRRRTPSDDVMVGAFPTADLPLLSNLDASVKSTLCLVSQVKAMSSRPEVFTEELTKRIHRMALRYSDILPYFVCNAYFVQRLDTIYHYLESQSMHFNRINCLLADCIFNKLHGHVAMYASVTVADSVQTRRDEIDQILAQLDGHSKVLRRAREDVAREVSIHLVGQQRHRRNNPPQNPGNTGANSGDDNVNEDENYQSSDEERR